VGSRVWEQLQHQQDVLVHDHAALAALAEDASLNPDAKLGDTRERHMQALQGWKVQGIQVP
jgi:hypothetical protein